MSPSKEQAESNMVPNYEIHLLLDPKAVLDSTNQLNPTVLDFFKPTKSIKMVIQYLDTDDKSMYNSGWIPRIRRVQGEADFELTYKRRYDVVDGEIDAALTIANKDGFDSTNTDYESQIEWAYKNQTLSLSRDESVSVSGDITTEENLDEEHSRDMLIEKVPDNFNDFKGNNWATDKLNRSRIYGPVFVERHSGMWVEENEKVDIEIWPIKNSDHTGMEYVVEASFKVKKRTKGLEKRDAMIKLLKKKGLLLERDSLKTKLIMERY